MSRLVNVEKLVEYKASGVSKLTEWQQGWNDALDTIMDELPTVDAVPVVRCKDCKHKPSGSGANHDVEFPDEICPCQCEDYWYSWVPKDNFFCAWGERKEDVFN